MVASRKANKSRKPNNTRAIRNNTRKQSKPKAFIPHCINEYAAAKIDPWHAEPCCRPDDLALRSYKTRIRSRGSVTIGTAGVGYIMCNAVVFNEHNNVYVTTADFAGTTVVYTGTGVSGIDPPKPYNDGVGVGGRAVSCGVRIAYTGTELNRSGLMFCCAGLGTGTRAIINSDVAQLGAMESTKIVRPDSNRSWVGVVKRTQNSDGTWYETVNSSTGNHSFGIMITGVPGETYAYDYALLAEYVPLEDNTLVPHLTESYASNDLAHKIDTYVDNSRGVLLRAGGPKPSFVQTIEKAVENIPEVIDTIGRYVAIGGKALDMASMFL